MHDVKIVLSIVPLLFAIILHEVSHGWVAERLGDPMPARILGRITLNPISHIDLMGTIIVPGILLLAGSHFLFGWAKPMPVNFANLRGGRRDMALVALSGPLSNFLLAVLSSIAAIDPNLKVVFTSGHTRDVVLNKGIEDKKFEFMTKPVSPHALLAKVREVLDK